MGLFDWFRKPKPHVPLPQLAYDVAYFILPHYAFHDVSKLVGMCLDSPTYAGAFFYVMATKAHQAEPIVEDAKRFCWHHGQLADGREYFVLEYPTPPPIDMSNVPLEDIASAAKSFVLAPHFSAVVRGPDGVQYFVLGQAPIGGGTTLRCVLPEGSNCNLGPGPRPELAAFLDAIAKRA